MSATFDCTICLNSPQGHSIRDYFVSIRCGHIFHSSCLVNHYKDKSKKCPICMKETKPEQWTKLCGVQAVDKSELVPTPLRTVQEQIVYDYKFKIILVGNSGVGKTCLARRFVEEGFRFNDGYTIGCDWFFKLIRVGNKDVYLSIWDTAGQDKFHSVVSNYYRHAHGAMLVYDVTEPSSVDGITTWVRNISDYSPANIIKVLIGNKADDEEKRKVSREQGKELAEKSQTSFYETSAKDAVNVDIAFRDLAAKILENVFSFEAAKAQKIGTKGGRSNNNNSIVKKCTTC